MPIAFPNLPTPSSPTESTSESPSPNSLLADIGSDVDAVTSSAEPPPPPPPSGQDSQNPLIGDINTDLKNSVSKNPLLTDIGSDLKSQPSSNSLIQDINTDINPATQAHLKDFESLLGKAQTGKAPDPLGVDCSSFVQGFFAKSGVKLPRTAIQQFRATKAYMVQGPAANGDAVDYEKLQPGDLVFIDNGRRDKFNTQGKGIGKGQFVNHVTVYVGGGRVLQDNGSGQISEFPLWGLKDKILGVTRPAALVNANVPPTGVFSPPSTDQLLAEQQKNPYEGLDLQQLLQIARKQSGGSSDFRGKLSPALQSALEQASEGEIEAGRGVRDTGGSNDPTVAISALSSQLGDIAAAANEKFNPVFAALKLSTNAVAKLQGRPDIGQKVTDQINALARQTGRPVGEVAPWLVGGMISGPATAALGVAALGKPAASDVEGIPNWIKTGQPPEGGLLESLAQAGRLFYGGSTDPWTGKPVTFEQQVQGGMSILQNSLIVEGGLEGLRKKLGKVNARKAINERLAQINEAGTAEQTEPSQDLFTTSEPKTSPESAAAQAAVAQAKAAADAVPDSLAHQIALETALGEADQVHHAESTGLGQLGEAGKAIGENLRQSLVDSADKTGKLPDQESGSLVNQVYEKMVADGAARGGDTAQRAIDLVDQAGNDAGEASRIYTQAAQPTAPEVNAHSPERLASMPASDLIKMADDSEQADKDLVVKLFGEEGAKKYNTALRQENSMDMSVSDRGSATRDAMESSLTDAQRNQLYGIGDAGLAPDELREYANKAFEIEDATNANQLGYVISKAVKEALGTPEDRSIDPFTDFTLRKAEIRAKELGLNPQDVMDAAIVRRLYFDGEHAPELLNMTPEDVNATAERVRQRVSEQPGSVPSLESANDPTAIATPGESDAWKTFEMSDQTKSGPYTESELREAVKTVLGNAEHTRTTPAAWLQSLLESLPDTKGGAVEVGDQLASLMHDLGIPTDELSKPLTPGELFTVQKALAPDTVIEGSGETTGSTGSTGDLGLPQKPSEGPTELGVQVVPGLGKFLSEDVGPAARALLVGMDKAGEEIGRLFNPVRGEYGRRMAGMIRDNAAALHIKGEQLVTKFAAAAKQFAKATEAAKLKFIDDWERGVPQSNPALQAIKDHFEQEYQSRIDQIRSFGKGHLENLIENYFPHIWEDPQAATQAYERILGKRPLEGSKGFLKQRTIPTIAEGMAEGLRPITTDPIELNIIKLREMDRYIMGQNVLREMKDAGIAEFVKAGTKPPTDYVPINDRIAQVFYRNEAGELVSGGKYYAPRDAARVINNYLSPGLRDQQWYRAANGINNSINMAQLGLSAFHATMSGLTDTVSTFAIGLDKLTAKDVSSGMRLSGLRDVVSSFIPGAAPIETFIKGGKFMKAIRNADPAMADMIDAFQQAGGRIRMDAMYDTGAAKAFWKAFSTGNIPGAAIRSPFALIDVLSAPLMKVIVPRIKLGAFARMAELDLARLGPNATLEDRRLVLGRAWDSVDNRYGQLVYDNLFWNKALKDVLHLAVRSVGWNVGDFRELGGAGMDFTSPSHYLDIIKAGGTTVKNPLLTKRMWFAASLPIVIGAYGALTQYLATRRAPRSLRDYFEPQIDDKGNRVVLPSYIKDVAAAATKGPEKYAEDKMSPLLHSMIEMYANRDYFGNQVHNPDDPIVKQAQEYASYALQQFKPISFKNFEMAARSGESGRAPAWRSFFGIVPVKNHTMTPDQQLRAEGMKLIEEASQHELPTKLKKKAPGTPSATPPGVGAPKFRLPSG